MKKYIKMFEEFDPNQEEEQVKDVAEENEESTTEEEEADGEDQEESEEVSKFLKGDMKTAPKEDEKMKSSGEKEPKTTAN